MVQRQLDKLALTIPDRIPAADFCLIESDFAGFAVCAAVCAAVIAAVMASRYVTA